MNILVLGEGGREHALCWKIRQSPLVKKLYCAPGNGGTARVAENVAMKADDVPAVLDFVRKHDIGFVVVGPEAPLMVGMTDELARAGIPAFGPSKAAAQLEGSKAFSKNIMKKYGVPTAAFGVFSDHAEAVAYVKRQGAPIVIKADGLAAGKGVYVCKTVDEALAGLDDIMVKKIFGAAGDRVVVEDCLPGEEASFLVFSDGEHVIPMDSAQDHKRIFDNDEGPNTGGMGAYSPAPVMTQEVFDKAMAQVIWPTIKGMAAEGSPFKGVLYAGLMVKDGEVSTLEFNTRFGDPEAQPLLSRIESDIVPVLMACAKGTLDQEFITWKEGPSVCVVLASGGYPGSYEKGKVIAGIDEAEAIPGVGVFHAGTKVVDGTTVTSGGRVLGVTATAKTLPETIALAYKAVEKISWEGMQYRKDIGKKALNRA